MKIIWCSILCTFMRSDLCLACTIQADASGQPDRVLVAADPTRALSLQATPSQPPSPGARTTHILTEHGLVRWRTDLPYRIHRAFIFEDGAVVGYGFESDELGVSVRPDPLNRSELYVLWIDAEGDIRREHRVPRGAQAPVGIAPGPGLPYPLFLTGNQKQRTANVYTQVERFAPDVEVMRISAETGDIQGIPVKIDCGASDGSTPVLKLMHVAPVSTGDDFLYFTREDGWATPGRQCGATLMILSGKGEIAVRRDYAGLFGAHWPDEGEKPTYEATAHGMSIMLPKASGGTLRIVCNREEGQDGVWLVEEEELPPAR